MSRLSEFAFGLALVMVIATAALFTDGSPNNPHSLMQAEATACRVVGPILADGELAKAGTVVMDSSDFVRFRTCGPAYLTFTAIGTEALGVYSRLVVSLNRQELANAQVRGRKPYVVKLTNSGWVVIAFVNDIYQPPANRHLRLEHLRLHNGP